MKHENSKLVINCIRNNTLTKFHTYKKSEEHMDKQNTSTCEGVQLALATVPHTHIY